jgi:hypothetical protein
MKISSDDYRVLDHYVRAVLKRNREGISKDTEAIEDIMHPLTGWLKGNQSEFIPYMKLKLSEWDNDKRVRSDQFFRRIKKS